MVASAAAKGRALVARLRMRLISFPLLAYAPAIVAEALGFYSDEGIEIDFVAHRGGWSAMNDALTRGDAEIAIGNMWLCRPRSQPSDVSHRRCVRQCGSVLATTDAWRAAPSAGPTSGFVHLVCRATYRPLGSRFASALRSRGGASGTWSARRP